MLRVRLGLEAARVDVGACARQHDAVDGVQQGADLGDVRTASKHQGQRTGDLGDRPQVSLADHLHGKPVLDTVRIPDHPDHWPSHRLAPHFSRGSFVRIDIG